MTYLGTVQLPLDALEPYPGNPRQGDVPVIEESLRRNEQYRAIVVRAKDPDNLDAGGTILAGNHTWLAAHNVGMQTIRAELHEVDDDTARRIVAVDNRAGDRGDYDERLLAELLTPLDDLSGTGYDEDDLAKLVRQMDDAEQQHHLAHGNAGSDDVAPPEEFAEFSNRIETDHECPECGHEWTGKCK